VLQELSSSGCIICGRDNPIGLRAVFQPEANGVSATLVVGKQFRGFDGVLQGGIVAGLLDDAMWWAVMTKGTLALTAEISVRYKAPVPVGEVIHVTGEVTEQRHRMFYCRARISASDGPVLAEAKAKFLPAPAQMAVTGVAGCEGKNTHQV
jgi:acyl-coenzyme A thioesterase PaaI-like protein